jgi:hypothetical protein
MAGRVAGRWALPASVGAIGLALIGIGQLGPNRTAIQDDLTSRSTQALTAAELAGMSVSFSGRDATINGAETPELADRAEAVVGAVDGVRVATADLTTGQASSQPTEAETPAATEPTATEPALTEPATEPAATESSAAAASPTAKPLVLPVGFTLADGTLTVTGTVRSKSAATKLMDAVTAAGNGWKVVDRLLVDGSLTAPAPKSGRLPAVTRLLAAAPIDGAKLVIQYNGDSVILRGAPADAEDERALLSAAAATVARTSDVVDGLDTP